MFYTTCNKINSRSRHYLSSVKKIKSLNPKKWVGIKNNFFSKDRINSRLTIEKFDKFYLAFSNSDSGNGYKIRMIIFDLDFKVLNTEILDRSLFNQNWNNHEQCYPYLIKLSNDKFLVFYNGNEYGKYGIGIIQGSITL